MSDLAASRFIVQTPEGQSMIRPDVERTEDATFDRVARRPSNPRPRTSADVEVPVPLEPIARSADRVGRLPRTTVIVVLTASQAAAPERLAHRLPYHEAATELIVVCAGSPRNTSAVERAFSGATFIHATPDQSVGDLRELGMRQAHGDIVLLVSGDQLLLPNSARDLERMAL